MAWVLGEPTVQQYFDSAGAPLTGGSIEFYVTGTSTPAAVASDSAGVTTATSYTLNANGAPQTSGGTAIALFFDNSITYKIVRKDASGVAIDPTIDPYSAPASSAVTASFSTTVEHQLGSAADASNIFTLVNTYTPGNGNLRVYLNGQLLRLGASYDYTETATNQVTLTYDPLDNDVYTFIAGADQTTASPNASSVAYDPAGTGAVSTNVQAKLREWISVKDYGATGDGATDDTAAIQAAIDAASAAGSSYGLGTMVTSPSNVATGQYPEVIFPPGVYKISSALTYGAYHNFFGYGAIIWQTVRTEDIFYSISIYLNTWRGIKMVGGRTQIHAQNTAGTGLEGVLIKIEDCDFNSTGDYAVRCLFGPTAGGEQARISNSRFFNFTQAVESTFDLITFDTIWAETSSSIQTNDTAWFNVDQANMENSVLVPAGSYNDAGSTTRYFDFTNGVSITNTRMGAEGGGGMPIAYCFGDVSTGGYPYQNGGRFVLRDCPAFYTGGSNRTDFGVLVLKTGICKSITIEGNQGSADGPYIRADLMTSTTLPTYLAGLASTNDQINIKISNNTKWADSLTESSANDDELLPYTVYEATKTGKTHPIVSTVRLPGPTSATTTPSSNDLEEYEYGDVSLTYDSNSGFTAATGISALICKYTKIGKKVHMSGGFSNDSTEPSLSAGDYIRLNGLPFNPEDTTATSGTQVIGNFISNDSIGSGNIASGPVIGNDSNGEITFYIANVTGTVPGNSAITFTIDYVED